MDINKFALSVLIIFWKKQKNLRFHRGEKPKGECKKRNRYIYIYLPILLTVYLVIGEDDKRWNSSTEKGRG